MSQLDLIVDPDTNLLVLKKHPGESVRRYIDVSGVINSGDAILTVDSITPTNQNKIAGSSNIVVSSITHNNAAEIQARYSGGTEDENYKIKASFQTVNGEQLEVDVMMYVRENF